MKKYFVALLLVVAGCRTFQPVTFDQINAETSPNPKLLPAMNLNINFNTPDYGVSKVTGDSENTSYSTNIAFDTVNIVKKEVNENITKSYGTKKGSMNVNINFVGWAIKNDETTIVDVVLAPFKYISMIYTLGMSCPVVIKEFGVDRRIREMHLSVEIIDNKNNLVKKYEEIVSNDEIFGCLCCTKELSSTDPNRKLNADNVKQAMKNIRNKIKEDYSYINSRLK